MISMTAFGHDTFEDENFTLYCIIKSVNSRYLEINVNLPATLQEYESSIVSKIKENISRGHVDVYVQLQNNSLSDIKDYVKAVKRIDDICKENKIKTTLSLNDLISSLKPNSVFTLYDKKEKEKIITALDLCIKNSLTQVLEEKNREGKATYNDLLNNINKFASALESVSNYSDQMEEIVQKNLNEKIKDYIEIDKIDPNTLLTEVALIVNRLTINEEIQRLKTHIQHFKTLLDSTDPVGKRLDFLCQEMLREVNTVGSKNQITEVSLQVVTLKDCLENIREQTRNVE